MDSGFTDVAHRRPGRLFEKTVNSAGSYLSSLQGGGPQPENAELKPVLGAYLQSVLIPSRHGRISLRNLQELKTLATTLDLMIMGRQAEMCDILAQRFLAVECADQDGNWSVAKHFELISDGRVSAATDQARRQALA